MKKNEVTTLTSLVNEGKKIARLSGNRDLNEKIVKAKMKTLEECGQLIPAIDRKSTRLNSSHSSQSRMPSSA